MGIPLNHYVFAGAFKQLHTIAWIAVVLKLAFVFGMVIIMFIIFFKINPKLKVLFAQFKKEEPTQTDNEKELFALRARRKSLCEICLFFAIGVLICSAFMGFAS
jgi:Na+(H+)/acetate symporter ActP